MKRNLSKFLIKAVHNDCRVLFLVEVYNNIYQNVKQDADYLEATMKEKELNEPYKKLNLSDEQQKIITQ